MPKETGTVTEVGVGNIQFYIPNDISSHPACVFDPGDEFCVRTVRDVGLLITPAELSPTVADLIDGLDLESAEPSADYPSVLADAPD